MVTRSPASGITIAACERALVPRFGPQVSPIEDENGRLRIVSPEATITLSALPAGLHATILGLAGNNRSLAAIVEDLATNGEPSAIPMHYAYLARLASQGILAHYLVDADGGELASIQPNGTGYQFHVRPFPAHTRLQLSRFCVMHQEADRIKLVSPVGHGLIRISEPALMGVIGLLMAPRNVEDILDHARAPGLDAETVSGFLTMCRNAGFLDVDACDSSEDPDRHLWSVHDLMFHAWSRYGQTDHVYGGVFRHIDDIEPAPALRLLPGSNRIRLPVPVLEDMLRDDPPLQAVVEARQSIYTYGEEPITIEDLGEFLYRTARVRWVGRQAVTSNLTGRTGDMEISSRPYPGGGRGYELELYLAIDQCTGIERGLYHYDPAGHQLSLVRGPDHLTESLIAYAGLASPGIRPQVLIVFGARFRRMMWKYDRMAYAAILKNAGVLMQQMYLAATVMKLAPSAQGSGNIETFAAATGNDPIIESSVGEFILGSRPGANRTNRPTMIYPDVMGDTP